MKKKIVFSLIGIILVSGILLTIVSKNATKRFMQDGVMFAVSIDGQVQDHFPTRDNYYVNIDCGSNARGRWMRLPSTANGTDDAYRIIVDKIDNSSNSTVECNVEFTTINTSNTSDSHFLNNTITGLIASGNTSATSGTNAMIVNETSQTETNSTNVTLSVGYRYEGQNPNNYIWFNNEMWRIIGLIPTCTSENCATKEDLVKIIRKDSIGGIAYDAKISGYTGAWGSNTLYQLLNNYYWGKKDNTNHATDQYCFGYANTSKTKCDYREIGISDSASDYYGNMVQEVIWNTGASTNSVTAKKIYGNEIKTQSVTGRIGLMNASDYGYASSTHTGNLSSYSSAAITLANWLYTNSYERIITQYTTANNALYVYYTGRVSNSNAYNGNAVRPVLYLKNSVYVTSGDGSEANPYQIGM